MSTFMRRSVVLSGSFRADPAGLAAVHAELAERYTVLSPIDVNWVDPDVEFVRGAHELDRPAGDIEGDHLAAIRDADFVWLFAPGGHVGTSASLEIGYAHACGTPVLSDTTPSDEVLASFVQPATIATAGELAAPAPGSGLAALQAYYAKVSKRRGWDDETARDTLMLIVEELGELAKEIRVSSGLSRAAGTNGTGLELADVQLYVVHLANRLGVDLAAAVTAKERINAARYPDLDELVASL